MPSKQKKSAFAVIAGIVFAAGAFFIQAPSAVAESTPSATNAATPSTVLGHWYTYYPDYFNYEYTCEARGQTIIGPKEDGGIPGIVDYSCYKLGGDLKWSMDVYDLNE